MKTRRKAPARVLALLALIGAIFAIVLVVQGSIGEDGKSKTNSPSRQAKKGRNDKPKKPAPKTYVVEDGDTLSAIAQSTGVPVAKIEKLNPDIDPQILIAGERLQLR